jgi:hypothetical protein
MGVEVVSCANKYGTFNISANPLKRLSSYLTENRICFMRNNWLRSCRQTVAAYCNYTEPINTPHKKNAELPNAKSGGTYNYRWALDS